MVLFQSMTQRLESIKYTVPTFPVCWCLNEPQFHMRANMVSFDKAFNLSAFVVDVHSKKLHVLYNTVPATW